jgi:hypothetical protein
LDDTGIYDDEWEMDFKTNPVYKAFATLETEEEVITGLQRLFWLVEEEFAQNPRPLLLLIERLELAIALNPNINFRIVRKGEKTIIYPRGAKLLDDALINDNLLWLKNYPMAAKSFNNALLSYQSRDENKYRNLLDDLRHAIEQLLKATLGKSKSLENQKNELLLWLKNHGVNQQIINMYHHLLFSNFSLYQNEAVKHGDKWSKMDLEFMIYLTGTFMRLILQIQENDEKS